MRFLGLEIGRLFFAICVVALHTAAFVDLSVPFGVFVSLGFARLAVPFFFVVTGFFFASMIERSGIWAWLGKVVRLYAIWSLVYLCLWAPRPVLSEDALWFTVFGYFHLWYLTALICAGALFSLIRHWPTPILFGLAVALYSVAVWLSYTSGAPDSLIPLRLDLAAYLFRNGLFFGLPFMILGLLLSRYKTLITARSQRQILLCVALVLVMIWGEARLQIAVFGIPIYRDCTLSLFLGAPVAFAVFYRLSAVRTGTYIGQFASALYFSHVMVLELLQLGAAKLGVWPSLTLLFFLTLTVSGTLSLLLLWIHRCWLRILS